MEREKLEEAISKANNEDSTDGMLVYYPVFGSSRDRTLQSVVNLHKDVEGLSPELINNMYQNVRFLDPPNNTQKSILPCTPLAMIKILEHLQIYNTFLDYGKRLFGRRITVINRSEVVGRPLAALLANDGAEVYSVDVTGIQQFSRGKGLRKQQHEVSEKVGWTLEDCLRESEVVISGVPGDNFKVPTQQVRDGAVCINFSSEKVGRCTFAVVLRRLTLCQNFTPDIKEKASIYVPAVGKVTIVILLRNLLVCPHCLHMPRCTPLTTLQRMVQNRPETRSQPAAAVEKPGTVEQSAPSGQ